MDQAICEEVIRGATNRQSKGPRVQWQWGNMIYEHCLQCISGRIAASLCPCRLPSNTIKSPNLSQNGFHLKLFENRLSAQRQKIAAQGDSLWCTNIPDEMNIPN